MESGFDVSEGVWEASSAVFTSDNVSESAGWSHEGRRDRRDWPRGWTQGPKISGGQKTVRPNVFSFEGVVGCEGDGSGVACTISELKPGKSNERQS